MQADYQGVGKPSPTAAGVQKEVRSEFLRPDRRVVDAQIEGQEGVPSHSIFSTLGASGQVLN